MHLLDVVLHDLTKMFCRFEPTIGGSFLTRVVSVEDVPVTLSIWDTAGLERFRSMVCLKLLAMQPHHLPALDAFVQVRIYYREAAAVVLVFDSTDRSSFASLTGWVREIQSVLHNDVLIAIACNKCDLSARRAVSVEQAQDFAESLDAMLFETSAMTGQGVDELFLDLSAMLLQRSQGDRSILGPHWFISFRLLFFQHHHRYTQQGPVLALPLCLSVIILSSL